MARRRSTGVQLSLDPGGLQENARPRAAECTPERSRLTDVLLPDTGPATDAIRARQCADGAADGRSDNGGTASPLRVHP